MKTARYDFLFISFHPCRFVCTLMQRLSWNTKHERSNFITLLAHGSANIGSAFRWLQKRDDNGQFCMAISSEFQAVSPCDRAQNYSEKKSSRVWQSRS